MIIFPVYARISYLNSSNSDTPSKFINHDYAHLEDFTSIPSYWINRARTDLHIAYWHTSHGSQLVNGLDELDAFMGGAGTYLYNDGGSGGRIDIDETSNDLSGNTAGFDDTTRTYLDNPSHSDVNVVMWSWCAPETNPVNIDTYLISMNQLEMEYPGIQFVYMTGHLNGGGEEGDVNLCNELIRDYCRNDNKILYDFADIESYDPDDNYFLDRGADDACNYDSGNWAVEWQEAHLTTRMENTSDVAHSYINGGTWFECAPAHASSAHVMGNMKVYGSWYLFAVLAGWFGN